MITKDWITIDPHFNTDIDPDSPSTDTTVTVTAVEEYKGRLPRYYNNIEALLVHEQDTDIKTHFNVEQLGSNTWSAINVSYNVDVPLIPTETTVFEFVSNAPQIIVRLDEKPNYANNGTAVLYGIIEYNIHHPDGSIETLANTTSITEVGKTYYLIPEDIGDPGAEDEYIVRFESDMTNNKSTEPQKYQFKVSGQLGTIMQETTITFSQPAGTLNYATSEVRCSYFHKGDIGTGVYFNLLAGADTAEPSTIEIDVWGNWNRPPGSNMNDNNDYTITFVKNNIQDPKLEHSISFTTLSPTSPFLSITDQNTGLINATSYRDIEQPDREYTVSGKLTLVLNSILEKDFSTKIVRQGNKLESAEIPIASPIQKDIILGAGFGPVDITSSNIGSKIEFNKVHQQVTYTSGHVKTETNFPVEYTLFNSGNNEVSSIHVDNLGTTIKPRGYLGRVIRKYSVHALAKPENSYIFTLENSLYQQANTITYSNAYWSLPEFFDVKDDASTLDLSSHTFSITGTFTSGSVLPMSIPLSTKKEDGTWYFASSESPNTWLRFISEQPKIQIDRNPNQDADRSSGLSISTKGIEITGLDKVYTKSFGIRQKAQASRLSISGIDNGTLTFPYTGGSKTITVTSTDPWAIQ